MGAPNFPPFVVVEGYTFTMPSWVSNHPCPNGHTDVEFVKAELDNETMTIEVHCKKCGVTFWDVYINQETIAASKEKLHEESRYLFDRLYKSCAYQKG